jgi:hypothetical protein
MAEFIWGAFLWFALISSVGRYTTRKVRFAVELCRARAGARVQAKGGVFSGAEGARRLTWRAAQGFHHITSNSFELLAAMLALIFLASSGWYASIKQADEENKIQSLAGLAFNAVALSAAFMFFACKRKQLM